MPVEIEATYKDGVLRPDRELALENGERIKLTWQPPRSPVKRLCGRIRWTGDIEELHR